MSRRCVYVVNICGESMGNRSMCIATHTQNYVNSGERHEERREVVFDLMQIYCSTATATVTAWHGNWIQLNWSTTHENRTLSVWLVAVFLSMNFDHYCSIIIIRIAWIMYFACARSLVVDAKMQYYVLDNIAHRRWGCLSVHKYIVRIDFPCGDCQ